jgi:site-specific DNA-methyltransferase (adenine-specific)
MKLFNNDCLKVLPTIPDKSIDLILTDPPYGTTQNKWDSIISLDKMWNELKRIVKEDCAITLFSQNPFSSILICSNLDMF